MVCKARDLVSGNDMAQTVHIPVQHPKHVPPQRGVGRPMNVGLRHRIRLAEYLACWIIIVERPGALSLQYNICGNPLCRCKAVPPIKHGPYPQISFTWNGKSTSQFVRQEDVEEVRQQLKNYHRLRDLVDEWIGLALELSRLRLRERRDALGVHKNGPKTTKSQQQSVRPRQKKAR